MPLGRHYHDQIMLGLFHAEVPYDTPAASWPQAVSACSMSDFDDHSPHETWDDLVEDDDALQHQDEYPTVQEIVRQSVRFTYTEPRVKPNTLAGLLALALGGTPVSVKDAAGNAWRQSMVPVHPFEMLSISAQIAHQQASHWQYTGLKATNFTLKTNGPYLSLSCELLGSGKREPVTSAWAPGVPEAWIEWGQCRLWLRDVGGSPLALPTEPQQGSTNLGAGAIDISTRVLRMEVTHRSMLWAEGGYRPSTRVYRGMLHPGGRSSSLLLELEVDTASETVELGYYLTQARLAFEWQYVGEVIVPGGTYRYGATLILPCLQLQRLEREEQGESDTLVLSGQVLSDRVNPPVQAWGYTAQPKYLAVPQWTWTQQYQEDFPYTTTWATVATYPEAWESQVWGQASENFPWQIFAGSGGVGFGNAGTLLTGASAIVGAGSVQVRMPRTGNTASATYFVEVSGHTMTVQNLTSGRWRTLLRPDLPPATGGATGVHWVCFRWSSYDSPASCYAFILEMPVESAVFSLWRYGVFNGSFLRPQFTTYQSGAVTMASGAVCALEVEWIADERNAKDIRNYVRFGVQSTFTDLPLLVFEQWRNGDAGQPVELPPRANFEGFTGLPQPLGVGLFTLDSTEVLQYSDSSLTQWYEQAWSTIWRAPSSGGNLLTHAVNNFTPTSGSGSLRIRRFRRNIVPVAAQRSAHGLQRTNRAGGTGLLHGRLHMVWRMDSSVGTRFNYVGGVCLARSAALGSVGTAWYGVLRECDQATAQWTRLLCVYFGNGIQNGCTVLQSVNLPAPIADHVFTMRVEWHMDNVANTVQLLGSMGTAVDGSDLVTAITYTGPKSVAQTVSYGEGPMALFECDGTVASDIDVTLDHCQLDHYVFAP